MLLSLDGYLHCGMTRIAGYAGLLSGMSLFGSMQCHGASKMVLRKVTYSECCFR